MPAHTMRALMMITAVAAGASGSARGNTPAHALRAAARHGKDGHARHVDGAKRGHACNRLAPSFAREQAGAPRHRCADTEEVLYGASSDVRGKQAVRCHRHDDENRMLSCRRWQVGGRAPALYKVPTLFTPLMRRRCVCTPEGGYVHEPRALFCLRAEPARGAPFCAPFMIRARRCRRRYAAHDKGKRIEYAVPVQAVLR